MNIEAYARQAGVLELQASYQAQRDEQPWGVTLITFEHGPQRDPGSMTGSGRGNGHTLEEAVTDAASKYQPANPNPTPEVEK